MKLQTDVDDDVHKKFKAVCALEGVQVGVKLAELVNKYLENNQVHLAKTKGKS